MSDGRRGEPEAAGPATDPPRVFVARRALAAQLTALARLVPIRTRTGDAVIAWDGEELVVEVGGQRCSVPAVGAWPGVVHVPALVLLRIPAWLPPADPLELRVDAGQLRIGPLAIPCAWDPSGTRPVQLPESPPLPLILSLAHRLTEDELARSGHAQLLATAQQRRDLLVRRAAAILEPLGVREDDLHDLVDAVVLALHPRPR